MTIKGVMAKETSFQVQLWNVCHGLCAVDFVRTLNVPCRCDLPSCLGLPSSLRDGGWETGTEHYGLNINSASVETMLDYSFEEYSSGLLYLCSILVLL